MEQSPASLRAQRALAALLVGLALAASWVESRSPLAAKIRSGRPYLFWVCARETREPAPRLHLGVYDPVRRALSVLYVPAETRLEARRTLGRAFVEALRASDDFSSASRAAQDLAGAKLAALAPEPADWTGAGRLTLDVGEPDEESEPPLRAALALKARSRSPRAWLRLARAAVSALSRGESDGADELLLALELRAVPVERLRPAWLPADELAAPLLGRLLSGEDRALEGAVTAEVLNGTDVDGLAAQAKKMLRLRGVDVIETRGAPRARERTVVYDRVGDFARAERVRALLGCRSARAVTRVDPSRAVDVSVELGADCAGLGARAGPDSR